MSPKRHITGSDIGLIIFLIVLMGPLLMQLSSSRPNWSVVMTFIFLMGIATSITWYFGSYQERKLVDAWTELARVTGLTFQIKGKSLTGNLIDPGLEGMYRGRRLSITRKIEYTSYDSEGGSSRTVYTVITLQLTNLADCSLSVQGKGILGKLFKKVKPISGDEEFDTRMDVLGSPDDFVQRAARRLAQDKSLLLAGSNETAMLASSPFPWLKWMIPVIKLQGPELEYRQQGIIKEAQVQIRYLNLLCTIADIVERQFNVTDARYISAQRFDV